MWLIGIRPKVGVVGAPARDGAEWMPRLVERNLAGFPATLPSSSTAAVPIATEPTKRLSGSRTSIERSRRCWAALRSGKWARFELESDVRDPLANPTLAGTNCRGGRRRTCGPARIAGSVEHDSPQSMEALPGERARLGRASLCKGGHRRTGSSAERGSVFSPVPPLWNRSAPR